MSTNSSAVPTLVITGAHPKLYNHDLAPTAPAGRTWGVFSLFAMWMSDVHSVGGYTFAASLFFLGLTGWQVLISMLVGIMVVYFLMNLIGRPSLRYGIPYPVVARISFGVMGANLAAVVRGVVGIVWYGVQTYFASKAVQVLIVERIGNPFVVIIGSVTFIVATMGINIVANFVSPAYDIANLWPERINFRLGGLITSVLSVMVCPWLFVASPQAITLFVSIFGAVLGPMFGIMVADYYLVKRQHVIVDDLYSMSPSGSFHYDGGWNPKALISLAIAGALSIGLALTGAYGLMFNVGDWGWLIGAGAGALIYRGLSSDAVRATALSPGE
jgi:cytosine/uracil/thiamine/allantoin permease